MKIKDMRIYGYMKKIVMEHLYEECYEGVEVVKTGEEVKELFDKIKEYPTCLDEMRFHDKMVSKIFGNFDDEIFEIYFKEILPYGDAPSNTYQMFREVARYILNEIEGEIDFNDNILENLKAYRTNKITMLERKSLLKLYDYHDFTSNEQELIEKIAYTMKNYFIDLYNETKAGCPNYETFCGQYEDILNDPANYISDFASIDRIIEGYLKSFYYEIIDLYIQVKCRGMVNNANSVFEFFIIVVEYIIGEVLNREVMYEQIKNKVVDTN